jgi:hypothetical protein
MFKSCPILNRRTVVDLHQRAKSASDQQFSSKKIGGFFALHEPDGGASEHSIYFRWTSGRSFAAFSNARSAFAALVNMVAPPRVWLPAYICPGLIAESWRSRISYYRMRDGLEPDIASFDRDVGPGDVLLAIDFFGFPPGADFLRFAQRRRDVLFVDDRAQALDAGVAPWADWTLYSPRKLLGVADGGILVAERAGREVPRPCGQADVVALWKAPLLRYEDRGENNNQVWHEANQAKMAWMHVNGCEITRWSAWILSRTSLDPLAERQRRNWRLLHNRLGRYLVCEGNSEAVPFGFIIKVPADHRTAILRALHSDGIFAAVHYPSLPSPADQFPAEHALRTQIITLPCDHRYDEDAMDVVSQKVLALMS